MKPLSRPRSVVGMFLRYFMYVIAYLIVAIPAYLLVFSVLPRFIRYTEPKEYEDSLLLATLYALSMGAVMMALTDRSKSRRRLDPS